MALRNLLMYYNKQDTVTVHLREVLIRQVLFVFEKEQKLRPL